ncbi:MAG: CDP-alcohol phosphatidyltransferase family protein [Gracilimonas sp.]|uniref:CDP-alcohol phosphatidyltransferase family protein n=1 Tax=Gracilimonas TaxID=649462 RepID=UPI001B0A9E83|nr:CDP-alcohol phosphatidyltransferase family protein [Gracilimonas sp.]MBO6584709.1 CDP-alcohol phosphatidyltransferase family protein [Gracilimonas sp.]MBO6616020.1 CDP-alcohol phosphatidyltransferase family protein [Gracilimonas sp.]
MSSKGFFSEYDKSIKNRIVEEGYDLYFSRPCGYVLAKFFHKLKFTPTNISVLGMLIGVTGGILLYWQDVLLYTSIGFVLVTFAGLMDSADGQAARIYDQRSEMGKYLDFFNDMLVFISCYLFGLLYFTDTYTLAGILALGLVSGYVHSIKSNLYEYYKGEFLHFSLTDSKHRNPPVDHIKENFDRTSSLLRKVTYPVLIDYVKRQNKIKFRSDETTRIFEEAREQDPQKFKEIYERNSRKMLAGWAWVCGSNVMRNGILVSSLFGRIDIYVIANIASYGLYLLVGKKQNQVDRRILKEIEDWDLTSLERTSAAEVQ